MAGLTVPRRCLAAEQPVGLRRWFGMYRRFAFAVLLAACNGGASVPPSTRATPQAVPRSAEGPEGNAAATLPAPSDAAPPAAPPVLVGWRRSLAESKRLAELAHPAFDVPGGYGGIRAVIERSRAALAADIAALPDDSPDLPEAACTLAREYDLDRSIVEALLHRAIALVRRRANGDASKLYSSLRRSYLNVQPGARWRSPTLEWEGDDGIMGGFVLWDCSTPDIGTLRIRLADLYSSEERYPVDPFTKQPHPGKPTSKRSLRGAALAELNSLYQEVSAAREAAGAATVLELATAVFCEPRRRAAVCVDRMTASKRAVAAREGVLHASDPELASTLVLHARLIVGRRGRLVPKAEDTYRRVLAEATPGAEARLHAATDLNSLLRAAKAAAKAQELEATFIADLERPAGLHAWTWATLAGDWAEVTIAEGRPEAAVRILTAAVRGLLQPLATCPFPEGCDNRAFAISLLQQHAALDPVAAPALLQQVSEIERVQKEQRAQRASEVARGMSEARL